MSSQDQFKYITKLRDKRILIIGGTSGIGFSVAEACVEHGAHVVVASSTSAKVSKTIERLKSAYPTFASNVNGTTCDLSKHETLEQNITALFEFAGKGVHHVVISAGDALQIIPLSAVSSDYLRDAPTVRFLAPMILSKIAPQFMVPGPESSITFTGGANSVKPSPGWGIFAAYGAGLEGLTRGMAKDLKPIRVNLVSPGAVLTEMWDTVPEEARKGMQEAFKAETLVGKLGTPQDVAEAYLYAMKDQFVTGSVISTDGGRILC